MLSEEPPSATTQSKEPVEPTEKMHEGVGIELHRLHGQLGLPGKRACSEFLRRRRVPTWVQREVQHVNGFTSNHCALSPTDESRYPWT